MSCFPKGLRECLWVECKWMVEVPKEGFMPNPCQDHKVRSGLPSFNLSSPLLWVMSSVCCEDWPLPQHGHYLSPLWPWVLPPDNTMLHEAPAWPAVFLNSKPCHTASSLLLAPPFPSLFNFHSRASFKIQLSCGNCIQGCKSSRKVWKHLFMLFNPTLPLILLSKIKVGDSIIFLSTSISLKLYCTEPSMSSSPWFYCL